MIDAAKLHDAIAAVAPIVGVSIGQPDDRTTWRVDFDPAATDAQKAAAQQAIGTFTEPQSVLSQDIMAQFTADDATKIQAAVASSPQFWLLWSALQAQKDPMETGNVRFRAGWSALVAVLGTDRMAAIAAALGVTVA